MDHARLEFWNLGLQKDTEAKIIAVKFNGIYFDENSRLNCSLAMTGMFWVPTSPLICFVS